jgi:uncharacterized protein with ParB-like and HNH nuclease domain
MPTQIIAPASSLKISHLYKRIKEGTLVLQPEFQRKFVWNNLHKEKFIQTILFGLPFPEIYIAQSGVDIETIKAVEVVVDGQQRLTTIIAYLDESSDSKEFGKTIRKYKDLSEGEKTDFLNYNVIVRDLGDVDQNQIKEIFKRINLTRYSLEQVEIHNAIYDGEFIMAAKELVEETDIKEFEVFSDSELSRMGDLLFVLLVMTTIENKGYFTRDKEIERYIIQYNNHYPNSRSLKKLFSDTVSLIKSLNLSKDSIWFRKSTFFTMFVELYKFGNIQNIRLLKNRLIQFEKTILSSKKDEKNTNEFSQFYSYMYSGTNDRSARVLRGQLFEKFVLSEFEPNSDKTQ